MPSPDSTHARADSASPSQGVAPPGRAAPRDQLFARPRPRVADFDFGPDTAAVFDDMLDRSVPLYPEILRMVGDLASTFVQAGTRVYDLGCSTGSGFLAVAPRLGATEGVEFIGVDSSRAMLDQAGEKLSAAGWDRPLRLVEHDLEGGYELSNASVVLLVLTLQFVRPIRRARLLRSIVDGLVPGGALILVEKVVGGDPVLNRTFIDHYHAFKKRQGYSELEIAQKRDALENVLVPYRVEENQELLRSVGFDAVEPFFRWFNFCGFVATRRAPKTRAGSDRT